MLENRVLITGGSGFVGTNLVSHFQALGWETVNLDYKRPRNKEHDDCWQCVNILNQELLTTITRSLKPSFFLHFAARTDLDEKQDLGAYATNVLGVGNVIGAIKATPSIRRVIFASSQLVCDPRRKPINEFDYQPTTQYGRSKAIGEKIVRETDDFQPIWTIVRPTSLWGPWFDLPYKKFFRMISQNLYMHPGNSMTMKQWGYVGNTVHQVQKLLEAPAPHVHGRTFYLADYEPVLLSEFAEHVQKAFGAKPIRTVPKNLLYIIGRVGDLAQKAGWKDPPLTSFRYNNLINSEIQDLEPLRKVVGPLPYSLDVGIALTVRWLRENDEGFQKKAAQKN